MASMLATIGTFCFLAFFLAMIAGGLFLVPWADRQRIRRVIEQSGGRVLRIDRSMPVLRSLFSERNTTFWRVRYRDDDGHIHVAECFASFLRCKIYKDEILDANGTDLR